MSTSSTIKKDFSWHEQMQTIVSGHNDVEIVCAWSSSGDAVSCQTSSLLLSAYSPFLRQSFSIEEESSVIFCQDFSQACVQTAIEFLTFGRNQSINDTFLAAELHSLLRCWGVKGFVIDGYEPPKEESTQVPSSGAFDKLSRISGLKIDAVIEPATKAVEPKNEETKKDEIVELDCKDEVKDDACKIEPETKREIAVKGFSRLAQLSGLTISSPSRRVSRHKRIANNDDDDDLYQPPEESNSPNEGSDDEYLPPTKKKKILARNDRRAPKLPQLQGVQITIQAPSGISRQRASRQDRALPVKHLSNQVTAIKRTSGQGQPLKHASVSDQKGIPCPICKAFNGNPTALDTHMQRHVLEEMGRLNMGEIDKVRPMYRSDWFLNQAPGKEIPWSELQCTFCGYSQDSLRSMRSHLASHLDQLKSGHKKCQICDEEFETQQIYQKHIRMHRNACYLCSKVFRWTKNYLTHLMVHLTQLVKPGLKVDFDNPPPLPKDPNSIHLKGSPQLVCPACDVNFAGPASLLPHFKHHVLEAFNGVTHCPTCRLDFSSVKDYIKHLPRHKKNIRYTCESCYKEYPSEKSLRRHEQEVCRRPTDAEFFCHVCGFVTERRSAFRDHRRQHEGGDKRPIRHCTACPKKLEGMKALKAHYIKDHNGILPYMCESCPQGFMVQSSLRNHRQETHEGMANYKCGLCEVRFKTKNGALKHVNAHFPEPTHRCTICLEGFSCTATGHIHIRKVHAGEGSLKIQITDKLREYRQKYCVQISPEKIAEENGNTRRKQTRPLTKVAL